MYKNEHEYNKYSSASRDDETKKYRKLFLGHLLAEEWESLRLQMYDSERWWYWESEYEDGQDKVGDEVKGVYMQSVYIGRSGCARIYWSITVLFENQYKWENIRLQRKDIIGRD